MKTSSAKSLGRVTVSPKEIKQEQSIQLRSASMGLGYVRNNLSGSENGRIGVVKSKSHFKGSNGDFIKRESVTGKFMEQKTSNGRMPFKGVRKSK
jgi:hypothetical protein